MTHLTACEATARLYYGHVVGYDYECADGCPVAPPPMARLSWWPEYEGSNDVALTLREADTPTLDEWRSEATDGRWS